VTGVLAELAAAVGPANLVTDPDLMRGYLVDWRGAHVGRAAAVVRPGGTEEVAAVLRACRAAGVGVVPQGGNTGLCGGAVPSADGGEVVLSTTRMRRIRELDRENRTITVEAGAVLAAVREAAGAAGLMFPLSLGSEGSCTIGGNLATNAGGAAVLRYGTMRELTLGLEVVLPDGRVWSGLRGLRKDNTGYDLKQLFVGAEGTLGVITAAVLRLFPAARSRVTAWVALPDPAAAVELLGLLPEDRLSCFELMSAESLDLVLAHVPGARSPVPGRWPWHALVELTDSRPEAALAEVLATVLERSPVADAVVAPGRVLWALREGVAEAQNKEGPSLKHDVTVPIGRIPEFVSRTDTALRAAVPGIRIVSYGHVGDGNLHYNLTKPRGTADDEFAARAEALATVVYDIVAALDGSISAEHGVGVAKRDVVAGYKPAVELAMMREIKALFDPGGLMNPGKVVFPAGG
jgi:FAD/FMN-containing dehydrogenase